MSPSQFSLGNLPMIIIPISQIEIPNPFFGVRIRANTLAIGAVNNEVGNQLEGWIIRYNTVMAMPICHSIITSFYTS